MAYRFALLSLVLCASALTACGKEIGDGCTFSTDCSPNGDRICDNLSTGGYCTIQGCDNATALCPDEAVCVQFFTGDFSDRMCTSTQECNEGMPATPPSGTNPGSPGYPGSLDELCALAGFCVPRSSEVRYCMRKCDSNGDCRDGYECRDKQKMIAHGGQPLLPADDDLQSTSLQKFCAPVGP